MSRPADEDYYAVLQVHPRAEPEVIEAAYRRLSRKYHPDVRRDADALQRMRALNEAFEVLGDPARRRAYDRRRPGGPGPPPADRLLTARDLLRPLLPYLALGILAVLAIRLAPLLLRPPVVIALSLGALVYFVLRRLRRR